MIRAERNSSLILSTEGFLNTLASWNLGSARPMPRQLN
jgi:hypothetical protein